MTTTFIKMEFSQQPSMEEVMAYIKLPGVRCQVAFEHGENNTTIYKEIQVYKDNEYKFSFALKDKDEVVGSFPAPEEKDDAEDTEAESEDEYINQHPAIIKLTRYEWKNLMDKDKFQRIYLSSVTTTSWEKLRKEHNIPKGRRYMLYCHSPPRCNVPNLELKIKKSRWSPVTTELVLTKDINNKRENGLYKKQYFYGDIYIVGKF